MSYEPTLKKVLLDLEKLKLIAFSEEHHLRSIFIDICSKRSGVCTWKLLYCYEINEDGAGRVLSSLNIFDKSQLTLEQLNSDCLECIFTRIHDLSTQVQTARVCQRFCNILTDLWRRNPDYHIFSLEEWRERLVQHEDLIYFLHIMCDYIKCIQIKDCLSAFLRDLEDLDVFCFKNVERCELLELTYCYPNDDDINALTTILPNVKYMNLAAPITGRYIAELSQLEELHLYDYQEKDYEIKDEYLREICEKLKNLRVLDIRNYEKSYLNLEYIRRCEKLAILKLNLNTLKPVLNDVLNLPHLKQLTVLLDYVIDVSLITNVDTHDNRIHETAEFYEIINAKSACITGIAIDNYYMPLTATWDENLNFWQFNKLQKFAFCNCTFPNDDVLERYTRMSELRLLSLRNWSCLTNATVLKFITLCPFLEHLDISYCKRLTGTLLYDALNILERKSVQRVVPLNIYYVLSGLDDEIESVNPNFWQKQKFIRFPNDFPPNSERGLSYVERGFEFEFE